MKEKWVSFLRRGNLGNLDCVEMVDSQEKEVIKEVLGCKGEEENQEDMDHLDSTEGSLAETDNQGFLAPLVRQAHQGQEASLVFQDFQETRVSQVLQVLLDFQDLMVQEDLKETKVILPVSLVHLAQRVSQVALDIKDILEAPESRVCLVFKGTEDHLEGQDHLAPLDHQGVQVARGYLGWRAIQEK